MIFKHLPLCVNASQESVATSTASLVSVVDTRDVDESGPPLFRGISLV